MDFHDIAVKRQFELHASRPASHTHRDFVNTKNSMNDVLTFAYRVRPIGRLPVALRTNPEPTFIV